MAAFIHFSIRQPASHILRDHSRSLLLNLEGCSGKTMVASSVISDTCFLFRELIILQEWKGFNLEFSAFGPLTGESQRSTPSWVSISTILTSWADLNASPLTSSSRGVPTSRRRLLTQSAPQLRKKLEYTCQSMNRLCDRRSRVGILVLTMHNLESFNNFSHLEN